jgi:hypothetical protein
LKKKRTEKRGEQGERKLYGKEEEKIMERYKEK